MSESIHCLMVSPRQASARGAGLLRDAHTLGLGRVSAIECHDLYFVEGALSPHARDRLADFQGPIAKGATDTQLDEMDKRAHAEKSGA